MNSENTSKSIDQIRVILGLLRETIFLQSRYEFNFDTFDKTVTAELVEVNEETRRNEEEDRVLVFRSKGISSDVFKVRDVNHSSDIRVRFGIDSFLVKGLVRLIRVVPSEGSHLFYTSVPTKVEIENSRKSRRKKNDCRLDVATVLVRSGSFHTEGVFELVDYSRGGYGGTLRVPSGFKMINDTYVQGMLHIGAEAIAIACRVKRARLLSKGNGDWDSYSVGLQNENLELIGDQIYSDLCERRQSTRLVVQEHVHLTAALNKDFKFRLLVEEASVTGFSGKLTNTAHLVEFPIGSSFQMESPSLTVSLRGFDGERLRFSIHTGTINERLEWFKRVSPYLLQGVSQSVFDARDLLEVFCASGALSTEYLKVQRTHRSSFLTPFESSSQDHFWVHRWVHHNHQKEVTGHWCAIRLGDNGWFIADLAGSPEKQKRIPKNFTELFFKSFAEFSLTQTPCPVHMYAWVIGHPYWIQFCDILRKSGLIRELVLTGYTRYSVENIKFTGKIQSVKKRFIKAVEYSEIWAISEKLKAKKCLQHALLFDFDVDRFGSPILTENFKKKGIAFARSYAEFEIGHSKWLAVFSTFPFGSSFNRVPESIWVFPLEGDEIEQKMHWQSLASELFATAISLGMKPSSIRRISLPDSSEPYPGELAMMENIIAHPSASNLYEGKK